MLYRVFAHLPAARTPAENGHPLYVWPRQGRGRVDDPDGTYSVLYVADAPAGAVAERFGIYASWPSEMFEGPVVLSGSRLALATIDAGPTRLLDLDDAAVLVELGLRPSEVVTRDRRVTQHWARRIHDSGRWDGVGWWSFRDPRWHSYGVWERTALRVVDVEPLDLDHPAVREAAEVLSR